jgi:2-dehydropantoate 2-reductase
MKWSKLLTNLVGNATSAILDMSVAELFANPLTFQLEMAMLREGLAVMRALNYPVVDLPKTPARALAFAVERLPAFIARPALARAVGAGRGGKRPSFHIDLHSGRGQTEVRWLNGAVARYGEQRHIPTPVNRLLTETLEGLSAGRLSKDDFRRKPEALIKRLRNYSALFQLSADRNRKSG